MARIPFTAAIKRVTPPWLQRTRGARLIESLAEQADELVDATVEGVALRFPGAFGTIDPGALALTGRERRIRRGPGEDAATYARRIQAWWDAHRTRGGPYALLGQLRAYFLDWLPVRMDVVYHSGTRRWMDEDGVITRDAIAWNADGTSLWAQFWLFLHVPEEILLARPLTDEDGSPLTDEDGSPLLAEVMIAPDALTSDDEAIFTAIPREWSAAHILRSYVVLLWGTRRLWDYPQPVPTYDELEAAGVTWDGNDPTVLTIEA